MDDEDSMNPEEEAKIVSLRPANAEGARVYERTMIDNARRYDQNACPHRGPYILDRKLATVGCQDCGALLNPMFVLEKLANRETYWNLRRMPATA